MDRLTQMRVFTTVVEKESFTGAADSLGMAKSTVSRQVSELETRLGVRLLYRTTRAIRPTDVGRSYFDRCSAILHDVSEADAAVRERAGDAVRGTLHISSAGLFATLHLVEPIASFRAKYPEVDFDLRLNDRFINLIEDGVDLAIRVTAKPRDSSLVARKLATTTHHLWASPEYLRKNGAPQTVEDLTQHGAVCRDPPGADWVLEGPNGEESVSVTPVLACNQGEPLVRAISAGLGIGLLPDFMTVEASKAGQIVPVLPAYKGWESGVYAVYPHRRLLSGRVRAFIDHLAEVWDPAPWQR